MQSDLTFLILLYRFNSLLQHKNVQFAHLSQKAQEHYKGFNNYYLFYSINLPQPMSGTRAPVVWPKAARVPLRVEAKPRADHVTTIYTSSARMSVFFF